MGSSCMAGRGGRGVEPAEPGITLGIGPRAPGGPTESPMRDAFSRRAYERPARRAHSQMPMLRQPHAHHRDAVTFADGQHDTE